MFKGLYWSLYHTSVPTHTHANVSRGLQSVVKVFLLDLVIISTELVKTTDKYYNSL